MTAAIGKEIERGMKAVTRGVDSQAPGRDCTERVFVISRFFCGLQIGDEHSNGVDELGRRFEYASPGVETECD